MANAMKTEIEKLKAMIESQKKTLGLIEEQLAALTEKPQELTRESGMQELNQKTFWIDNEGDVCPSTIQPKNDFDLFNSFNTKEEAETERDYTLASRRVRAWAKAANGDWKADWRNKDQEKYGVSFDNNELCVDYNNSFNWFIHQIAFPSQELATKFLELFRPELEILSNP
jgi:hypothetical protein